MPPTMQHDGHGITLGFADDADVQMEERSVTPPAIAQGGEINATTHQNTAWRTRHPKTLSQLNPMQLTVVYSLDFITEILTMKGSNQLITITYPDTSTLAFWGWIDEFVPGPYVEGEQPTADLTIIPSLLNASDVETAPVFTPVA